MPGRGCKTGGGGGPVTISGGPTGTGPTGMIGGTMQWPRTGRNPGAQMLFNSTYAVYIRGGRHTLSHILDGPDLVEELVN